jgi:uncharacterized damage-inducible protein DinB
MNAIELVMQSLEENDKYVKDALTYLKEDELTWRPQPHSNSIIFLLWHLARVEDFWINMALKGGKQIYETQNWFKQFKTPAADFGGFYDVEALKNWSVPSLKLINEYKTAVRKTTLAYITPLTEKQLDEPKDFGWNKGTIGSALKHLICEVGEHSGQIGYIKGIMKGIEPPPDFTKKK